MQDYDISSQLDSLTGAYSRQALESFLPQAYEQACSAPNPLCQVVIDLDYFKSINDAFGHGRGDAVLVEFVRRAQKLIRNRDLLFRYGGDEFVLLLQGANLKTGASVAQRLLETVRSEPFSGEPPLSLSLSIGVAESGEVETLEGLFEKADARLLEAKRRGRGCVVANDLLSEARSAGAVISRLAERETQLEHAHHFLERLPAEGRGLFLVSGPRGSGRTRFLDEMVKTAGLRGFEVIHLQARPALQVRSFGALLDAGIAWQEVPLETQTVEAFLDELPLWVQARGKSGLVIAVDDAEWLDPDSLKVLLELQSRHQDLRIGLMMSFEGQPTKQIASWETTLRAEVQLPPLTLGGVRVWLRHLLQSEPKEAFLSWLYEQSAGIPAAIEHMLKLIYEEGLQTELQDAGEDAIRILDENLVGRIQDYRQQRPNNLPALTSFVGRDREIRQVHRLLKEGRLVTLLGPGGIGKTRLGLQLAAEQLPEQRDGAYFVALAGIESHEQIVPTIVNDLNLSLYGNQSPKEQLLAYLRNKEMLILLDNFEHVVEGANLIHDILAAAPGITILVSSRMRLDFEHEKVIEIQGMELPSSDDPAGALASPAVQLFVQRTKDDVANIEFDEAELAHIIRICRVVEGMPLGIELAAAWLKMLSPQQIADQIEQNLDALLISNRKDSKRNRSLRAVFDQFWGFLTESERSICRKLSLFRAGFRLEAAQEVAGTSFFFVSALVDKALLTRSASGRYRMHEVLRQYANEELRALPQEHQQALAGQCEHFTGWLAERTPLLFGAEQLDALQKVGEESENLRAAWRWALEQGDLAAMNSLLDGLARFFEMRARFEEGEALMEQAVERLQALGAPGDPLRGRLLMYQGRLSLQCGINIKETQTRLEGAQRLLPATSFPKESIFIQSHLGEAGRVLGDMQAAATALERALTLVETTEAPAETAMAQNYYGILQATQGKLAVAREHFEAGIGCLLPMGDAWGTLKVRSNLGNVLAMLKEFDVARQNMEELLELVRVFDSHGLHATILGNLGTLMYDTGEYSKAGPYYLDSLRIARQYGMVWIEGNALVNLADLHLLEKQWTRARDRYLEGLRIAEAHQNFQLAILGVTGLAQLAIAQGDLSLAAQLLAYVREHPANCGSLEERYEETLQQFRNCSTNGFDALPEAPGSLQEALPELYALAA